MVRLAACGFRRGWFSVAEKLCKGVCQEGGGGGRGQRDKRGWVEGDQGGVSWVLLDELMQVRERRQTLKQHQWG